MKHTKCDTYFRSFYSNAEITAFESIRDKPPDMGKVIALNASTGLPAQDDNPVVFVNIAKLTDIPDKALQKYSKEHRFTISSWLAMERLNAVSSTNCGRF